MTRASVVLAVACAVTAPGCDEVFGLSGRGELVDVPVDAGPCMAPQLGGRTDVISPIQLPGPGGHLASAKRMAVFGDEVYIASEANVWFVDRTGGTPSQLVAFDPDGLEVESLALSHDGKTMWVEQGDLGEYSLWTASRPNAMTQSWLTATQMSFDLDGRMIPSAVVAYGGELRLVLSNMSRLREYASTDDGVTWSEIPGAFGWSGGSADDGDPYLSSDGCWVLFTATRASPNDYDHYLTIRHSSGYFETPIRVAELSSAEEDYSAVINPLVPQEIWLLRGPDAQFANKVVISTGP